MTEKFIAAVDSLIKGSRVITLDRELPIDEYNKKYVCVDGKTYLWHCTMNEQLIVVDTTDSLLGKEIEFV
ncbi:MAG: hypothetical protein LUG85_02765 [Clostridiales bacterium]|nr:hypothetical protein [Clostridiales bacterium]